MTPARTNAVTPQVRTASKPVSGLFLVQFEQAPNASDLAQLKAEGVLLLKYVPEDAYIARFQGAFPERVRALSSVRWVGDYRPDHKVHPRLAVAVTSAGAAGSLVSINLMLSRDVTPDQLGVARSKISSIDHQSTLRQGTILRGKIQPARVSELAQSDAVLWIEQAPKRRLVDELASKLVGGDTGKAGTPTVTQEIGYGGEGVIVCVADTGLDTGDTNTMHPDLRGRVTGFQPYGSIADGSDGYGHGTHAAGIVAGNAATGETDSSTGAFYGLGVASAASLFIERIFDDGAAEANPPPADSDLTRDAVRHGATIGSNSWGNDVQGEYDTDAAQFDELVRDADPSTPGDQPYILEFSAGNAGPASQTLDSPASGKNVIATGASENVSGTMSQNFGLYDDGPDTMADFSSRGPCEDGRLKPDLVAPGTWIASLASSSAPNEAAVAWSTIDPYYVYMGGTSMSGPHAAGAAAVFVQFYRATHTNATPSPALVKAALINSANELDQSNGGPGPIPNNDEGWGRINLPNIIVTNQNTAPRFYQYLDQTVLLTSGQVYEQHAFVQSPDQPLKITLAYTDVPGFPGAIPALVNDLDLEVVAPDGTVYRGNQFAAGESIANAPGADNLNNVEAVHLGQPAAGNYLVRVRARNVAEDARLDTASVDQDFALVISGDLSRPGVGLILMDRTNYTAPGVINLEVLDPARSGSGSVNILVKSSTETTGENIVLSASGNYGLFTGAVATVTGAAIPDGKLEIHNSDAIEADYTDAAGARRSAFATAQLVPPSVNGVSVSSDLGIITITWQTSEPADSVVLLGTNGVFNRSVTNADMVVAHTIRLRGLVAGKTYSFYVVSTDEAGNATLNNNGGAFYSFIALPTPTILLVDDYDTPAESGSGSKVIDDGAYTNAIAAAGLSFAFWKVTTRGSPQLSDLQPFPVVIWRTTDDIVNYGVTPDGLPDPSATNNTLTAQQQFMIQNYLNGGGSFFMASMGILSQLGDVSFRKNVLQVAGFKQNPDPPAPCSDCDEDFGVPAFVGSAASPITRGMSVPLDYSNYPAFDDGFGDVYGPDFSDTFTPGTNATAIAFESVSGKACGMSFPRVGFDSPGRVVFLSFPLDAVPLNGTSPDNVVALIRQVVNFLVPGVNGVGTVYLDNSAYTIPDKVTVEVGDLDLAGSGQAQVTFSTSSSNRLTLTLNESSHPGLFRGSIVLVATNATGNQLLARNGDILTASYFDASSGTNVLATARIDTTPPVISAVAASADIAQAQVSWITTKPSDSLVQYGESVLLDRTAYNPAIVTNHSVSITGLAADRTYYYQVVSRDQAGNTAEDDNKGTLYTFQTLPALNPPWSDNLETGAKGWTVVPDPQGTDMNWVLGTPNNGLVNAAHSGTNAWGSDLQGQQINTFASSYLFSPIIDLSRVSQATLSFWDCFDFSSGLEEGQILISTNSAASLTTLPVLSDFSGQSATSWQQETLDLTPYAGKTIQVVWDYAGASIGSPTYGWLIDDISITGTQAGTGGTVVISNNLSQASFTIDGPLTQTGSGLLTTITNAPPGTYSIQFRDVPFYETPTPQTNTLSAKSSITFGGKYTFIDANHNGISDAWEKYYLGAVITNRSGSIDSDGDGMTDYQEFIAGTDPTNAASKLVFVGAAVETNSAVIFQWSAVPGRSYQLVSSTDLATWTPVTSWMLSSKSPMTFTVTNLSGAARSFRVQVRP
ncbi:MAG TPA: S8 family serine peptidase [Verrucomicrobiae bacterium]|nr:S8 family serine peptidase [Verrucomicrobiae bacterium]